MCILGLRFSAVEARRYGTDSGSVSKEEFTITQVILKVEKNAEDEAAIEFRFGINYARSGSISLLGSVIKKCDPAKLIATWEQSHELPATMKEEVDRAILEYCTAEAVELAHNTQLPLPIKDIPAHVPLDSKFKIALIDAKRFAKVDEKYPSIQIGHGATITNITEQDKTRIKVEYRYTVTMSNVGMINLEGVLAYEGDVAKLMGEWNANKKLPNEDTESIVNNILVKGSLQALVLCKKLELPPPIKIEIPKIKLGQPTGKASDGMEVA